MAESKVHPSEFRCPNCGEHFVVGKLTLDRFTCPRCLSSLKFTGASEPIVVPRPSFIFDEAEPRSLEAQAQDDRQLTSWLICAAIIVAAVGTFVIVYAGPKNIGIPVSEIVGFLALCVFGIPIVLLIWHTGRGLLGPEIPDATADDTGAALTESPHAPGTRLVLEYATPRPRAHPAATAVQLWVQFFIGLIVGVVADAAFLFGGGAGGIIAVLCLTTVLGFGLLFSAATRGLGIGLILSPGLSFLILLGICGGFRC